MKVLVIAAHPDDEVLGCGGTIARHVAAGDSVSAMFMTDGVSARSEYNGGIAAIVRQQARNAACAILGVEPALESLPTRTHDNQLDALPLLKIVQAFEYIAKNVKPDIIYTHHGGDLNIDHRIVHQATMTAFRPQPGSTVKAIYAYEVPSSTEWASDTLPAFRPNHFVDVSGFMEQKIAALQAYEEELREFPHPRSVEAVKALAAWRGASVGLKAAEAFMTVRSIQA